MAKIVARNAAILVAGHNISGESNNCVLTRSAEQPEVTCFGDTTRQRLANSITDVEFRLDGFFNNSASSTDALLSEFHGSENYIAFLPQGMSSCTIAHTVRSNESNYEIVSALADACTVSATFTGGSYARGKCVYAGSVAGSSQTAGLNFTAADTTSYFTIHILSASTSIGASVQHSTDDAAWTTDSVYNGISTSGITYAGSIANAGKYRRVRYDFAGGSAAFLATFSGSSV